MADKKVTELTAITKLSGDDLLMVVNDPEGSPQSRKVTVDNVFANVVSDTVHNGLVTMKANTEVSGSTLTISANATFEGDMRVTEDTPASNNSLNEGHDKGAIWFDSDYLYVAVSNTSIRRVSLSTFT